MKGEPSSLKRTSVDGPTEPAGRPGKMAFIAAWLGRLPAVGKNERGITKPPLLLRGSDQPLMKNSRSFWKAGLRLSQSTLIMTLPRPSAEFMPISMLKPFSSASPSMVAPVRKFMSTPSKSFFNTKFTTPAMASGPYTAEAPPVITSTLAMAEAGIVLTSTTSAALAGWARRPSIRMRLRLVPRPRRFSVAAPGVLVALFWMLEENCVPAGTNCGIWLSTDSMVPVDEF